LFGINDTRASNCLRLYLVEY